MQAFVVPDGTKVVVLTEDVSEPWSFTGWTLKYKQVGADRWGWKLVDPNGKEYKDITNSHGYYVRYNCNNVSDLITSVLSGSRAKEVLSHYLLSQNGNEKSVTL